MPAESIRALLARPRTLIAGVAMVVIAVMAMVVLPTLTDAASRKVLADLDALGSNAWIVTPQQLPTGPPALIPPGGLARASDLPGVSSAVRVVSTTLQVRLSRQDNRLNSLSVVGLGSAVVTDTATALSMDPAATDQMVVRESGGLTAERIRAAVDPLGGTAMAVSQPAALVAARAQSNQTLSGLAVTATIVAFAVAALGITIMLTSAVRQRTAELAVRRVHGARARSIAALISAEALLIGVIGGLIALAASNATVIAVIAAQDWPPTTKDTRMNYACLCGTGTVALWYGDYGAGSGPAGRPAG